MSSTLTNLTAATTWSGTDLFYALVGGNSRKILARSLLVCDQQDVLSQVNSTSLQTLRIYSTYTDSSNYLRFAINTGSNYIDMRAETAGTGTDNVELRLTPAGTSAVIFGGYLHVVPGSPIPSGGASTMWIGFGSQASYTFGIYVGSGAPTVSAGQGSLYLRSDGSSNVTRMYVNTNGSTTWTAVNTVA